VTNGLERKGLTIRSILGIVYAGMILQPAVLWLALVTGLGPVGINFAATLFVTELALLAGSPLSKQETFIVYLFSFLTLVPAGVTAFGEAVFLNLIYNQYFAVNALYGFNIPPWFCPVSSETVYMRSFLHPDWTIPALFMVIFTLLFKIADISMALLCREIFIKQEKLPFPLAEVDAQACLTLGEREEDKMRVFSLSALIVFAYALIAYGTPMLSHAIFGVATTPIPIPWFDFNYNLEPILPGASFGIATDPMTFVFGFILPLSVIVSMFASSFAIFFIGNYLMKEWGLWAQWLPGMNVGDSYTQSILHVWAPAIIGVSVSAALIPLLARPQILIRAFKSIVKIELKAVEPGEVPPFVFLIGYLASTAATAFLFHLLVPDFPWIIIVFITIIWPLILSLYTSRGRGETGLSLEVPYIREGLTLLSGYRGIDVWLVPLRGFPSASGGAHVQWLKVSEMLGVKVTDYIKGYFIALAIALVMNFIYTSIIWSMAPIPSYVFPAAQIYWPLSASFFKLWISGGVSLINPPLIFGGAVIIGLLYAFSQLLHVPISVIGVAGGMTTPIPTATTLLIGGLVGRFVFQRVMGRDWWQKYRAVIVAGAGTGIGVGMGLVGGLAIVLRSMGAVRY